MEVTGLDQIPVACRLRNVAQASPVVQWRSGRDPARQRFLGVYSFDTNESSSRFETRIAREMCGSTFSARNLTGMSS